MTKRVSEHVSHVRQEVAGVAKLGVTRTPRHDADVLPLEPADPGLVGNLRVRSSHEYHYTECNNSFTKFLPRWSVSFVPQGMIPYPDLTTLFALYRGTRFRRSRCSG